MIFVLGSPSSSQAKDTGLSRRRQGFKSPWGRQYYYRKASASVGAFLFWLFDQAKGIPIFIGATGVQIPLGTPVLLSKSFGIGRGFFWLFDQAKGIPIFIGATGVQIPL